MNIKTWRQRCEEHPDHNGVVSNGMIQSRMQEEIDELRAAIEQRQWQGLTDQDAIALWKDRSDGPTNREIISFCRAIEAKLKERNT